MRCRLVEAAAIAIAVGFGAGCAGPDPAWDDLHARSQLEARAMVGKEYILVAPARLCRDPADVYNRAFYGNLVPAACRPVTGGRFRVDDVVALKNDGRTLLRIAGPDFAGYIAYETFLPKPFRDVQDYFATGRGP